MNRPAGIPKKLKICGQTWRVKTSEAVNRHLGTDSYFGRSIFAEQEIQLRTNERPVDAVLETFLHEIIHIVLANSGQLKTILSNRKSEEAITEALSCGLFQVLHDNPEIKF